MPPYLVALIGSLLRVALGGTGAWLIDNGITTADQNAQLYTGMVTLVAGLVWAAWRHLKPEDK